MPFKYLPNGTLQHDFLKLAMKKTTKKNFVYKKCVTKCNYSFMPNKWLTLVIINPDKREKKQYPQ